LHHEDELFQIPPDLEKARMHAEAQKARYLNPKCTSEIKK